MLTADQAIARLLGLGVLLLLGVLFLALRPRTVQADTPLAIGPVVPLSPVPFQVGDVLVATGGSTIYHYHPDGTYVRSLNAQNSGSYQTGMCFDAAGRLYTTNWSSYNLTQFDPLGQVLAYPWGGPFTLHPESCAHDAAGNMYVGQAGAFNRISKFDPAGNLLATYSPPSGGTDRLDLAADQCTLYYTAQTFQVMRFDVCTNMQLPNLAYLGTQNYDLRILPNGEVLIGTTIGVYRLGPDGSILHIYWNSLYDETGFIRALALDPDGTTFWATTDNLRGRVHRINIVTGAEQTYFNTPPVAGNLGLAVFGDQPIGQRTATPTATIAVSTNTATLSPAATATFSPPTQTPTAWPATNTATPSPTSTILPLKMTATLPPPQTFCPTQTPTRIPTPLYTPASGCTARPRLGEVRALITDHPLTTEALFTNRSTCSYPIGLAIYKKHDSLIEHQQLYDYTLSVIPPHSTLLLSVNNPTCAYQADAFWGELIESFAGGVRYGARRLDDTDGQGSNYCPTWCLVDQAALTSGEPPR